MNADADKHRIAPDGPRPALAELRLTVYGRRRFLAASVMSIAALQLGVFCPSEARPGDAGSADPPAREGNGGMQQATPAAIPLPVEGGLPSYDGATGWLNSP